jgi:hypothetical protein
MNIAKAPDEILDALKEHELALAELYEVYAEKFPEYKDFWTKFSSEEIQHADCINSLQTIVEESNEDFIVERFKIGAIENSTKYVKNLADTARQSDIPLIKALSTAVYLEQALIEKNYFEVFESDNAQTKHILSLLAEGTRKHYEKLRAAWQEHKGQ